jgi:hypothetical protein
MVVAARAIEEEEDVGVAERCSAVGVAAVVGGGVR